MRAGVVDREHLAVVGVEDRDRWIRVDPPGLAAGQGREWADLEHDLNLPVVVSCIELRNWIRNMQQRDGRGRPLSSAVLPEFRRRAQPFRL